MEYLAVFAYEFYPHGRNKKFQVFDKREIWKFVSADDEKARAEALNHKHVLESNSKITNVKLEKLVQGREIPLS